MDNKSSYAEDIPDSQDKPVEPKVKIYPRELVEDCLQISAGVFDKRIWQIMDDYELSIANFDNPTGHLKLKKMGLSLNLDYEMVAEESILGLNYWFNGVWRVQEVYIEKLPTLFGERPYLVCECGHRGNLYLHPGLPRWLCRECANLTYEVKKYDRRTVIGTLGYYLNRHLKLAELNERIKRIDYGGKLTRRAKSVVNFAKKWKVNV